jgi:hypothetical protein
MKLKIDKEKIVPFLVGFILASIIAPIIVHVVTNFVVDPYLNPEEPELEILAREPVFFYPGEDVMFNITFENVGKKTASELFIRAYTESYENKSSYSHEPGYDQILQVGEITSAQFEFTAPDNITEYPTWTMRVVITTTDDYSWDFEITYVSSSDHRLYHITPRT